MLAFLPTFLAACIAVVLGPQTPDALPVGIALTYARTVVAEGDILVSFDTVPTNEVRRSENGRVPGRPLIEEAARIAGFPSGRTDEALVCAVRGACRTLGSFRGVVQVAEYRRVALDSAVVTLRTLYHAPGPDPLYEQVDDVHVSRVAPESDWRITSVVRISES
jgi:hypothetical protein